MGRSGPALTQRAWWPRLVKSAGLLLAVVFVAAVVIDSIVGHEHTRLFVSAGIQLGGLLLLALSRRRSPGWILAAEVALAVVAHGVAPAGGGNVSSLLVAAAVYGFGVSHPTARSVQVAAGTWVILVAGSLAAGSYIGVIPMDFILVTAATAIALYVRSHRDLVESMRVRTEQAEREQRWMADRAVSAERVRIARDLHDVIAHHVSLLVVQAGAVRESLPVDHPNRVILDSMITGGRQAMTEMRDMLTALRLPEGQDATTSSNMVSEASAQTAFLADSAGLPPGPPLAPRHPHPGLSDIPELVQGARRAGQSVNLYLEGSPVDVVPTTTALVAYRIVQEALTNVVKHAPGAPTTVRVIHGPGTLEVRVRNGSSPLGPRPQAPALGGHGLLGMRERVALTSGGLSAGPTEDGFSVSAWLPVTAPPVSPSPPPAPPPPPAPAPAGRA